MGDALDWNNHFLGNAYTMYHRLFSLSQPYKPGYLLTCWHVSTDETALARNKGR